MYFIVGAFSSVGVFINVFRAFSSVGMFMGHLPFRGTFFVFRALAVGGGGSVFVSRDLVVWGYFLFITWFWGIQQSGGICFFCCVFCA